MTLFVSTLGSLQIAVDGRDITPSAPKLRSLLALLALRHNRVVSTGSLIEELWGDAAPVSALATLQTYVYQLRRLFQSCGAGQDILVTRPLGYEIRLTQDELDIEYFNRLVEKARMHMHSDAVDSALELLTEALSLHTAAPLHDVSVGPVLEGYVARLAEALLQAEELRCDAKMRLGQNHEVVVELRSMCVNHPFHEGLHAKLISSLQKAGRRSEGLAVYQTLRQKLVDELGIEPSADIRALQDELLSADTPSAPLVAREIVPAALAPRQLPRAIVEFAGRHNELRHLTGMLEAPSDGEAPAVVAVSGPPGSGKTATAIQACHLVKDAYPDGQLYADLRGCGDDPADERSVLAQFLRSVGFSGDQVPDDRDERAALFRSWTAGKTVLVLLDNVASPAQVAPLLPSGGHSAALITSCNPSIHALEGVQSMPLDVPSIDDCLQILRAIGGAERIAAEPDSAYTVVRLCEQLPLALRIVGAKLSLAPSQSLAAMAARLLEPAERLAQLRFGEWDLRDTVRSGLRGLNGEALALLRFVYGSGVAPINRAGMAKVCGLDRVSMEIAIEQLTRARVVHTVDIDGDDEAFVLPVITRAYLSELWGTGRTDADDTPAQSEPVPSGHAHV